jgi:hypothetical protein
VIFCSHSLLENNKDVILTFSEMKVMSTYHFVPDTRAPFPPVAPNGMSRRSTNLPTAPRHFIDNSLIVQRTKLFDDSPFKSVRRTIRSRHNLQFEIKATVLDAMTGDARMIHAVEWDAEVRRTEEREVGEAFRKYSATLSVTPSIAIVKMSLLTLMTNPFRSSLRR